MIVGNDDGLGILNGCQAQHLARVHQNRVQRSMADKFKAKQLVMSVQQENAETFLFRLKPRRGDDLLTPEIHDLWRVFNLRTVHGALAQADNFKFSGCFGLRGRTRRATVLTDFDF